MNLESLDEIGRLRDIREGALKLTSAAFTFPLSDISVYSEGGRIDVKKFAAVAIAEKFRGNARDDIAAIDVALCLYAGEGGGERDVADSRCAVGDEPGRFENTCRQGCQRAAEAMAGDEALS